jgi:hypothetical protein
MAQLILRIFGPRDHLPIVYLQDDWWYFMIIYGYLDDWIKPATISYPAISDAQIGFEASPKSTGFPAALAVVAALALVKPRRPRIWEVATTVQPSYTPRGLLWPALQGYKLQNQPTSNWEFVCYLFCSGCRDEQPFAYFSFYSAAASLVLGLWSNIL